MKGNGGTSDWGQESGSGTSTGWQSERQREMEDLRRRIANAEALLANCRAANIALLEEIATLEARLDDCA